MSAYTINLLEIPYTLVMPIIEWCVSNDIEVERCIHMLEVWHSKSDLYPPDWELNLEGEQALLFCLRWGNGTA